jgi:LysR family transcriptional regulator, cys regulon transcriptional activator
LHLATTHTQARYVLPPVIAKFRQAFPKVRLVLHQANPREIAAMLVDGSADVGIATEALADEVDLASFPYFRWSHGVIVPNDHALAKVKRLSLADLATYPIVTYDAAFTGRTKIDAAFLAAGLAPDVVLSALDSDVIKTYVEVGLGIGIITAIAFDPDRDTRLTMLDASHLFASSVSRIAVRRGRYLRDFAYRFIELTAPELVEAQVRAGAQNIS